MTAMNKKVHKWYVQPDDAIDRFILTAVQRLPRHQEILIEVNCVESPHRFFFNYLGPHYWRRFQPLMRRIQDFYRFPDPEYIIPRAKLRPGIPCVVKFQAVFFRGVVLAATEDHVKVFTYDYGEQVCVAMARYGQHPLFWLRSEFAALPAQALCGCLDTLEPVQGAWRRAAADALMDLLHDRELRVAVGAEVRRRPPPPAPPPPPPPQTLAGDAVPLRLEAPGLRVESRLVGAGLAAWRVACVPRVGADPGGGETAWAGGRTQAAAARMAGEPRAPGAWMPPQPAGPQDVELLLRAQQLAHRVDRATLLRCLAARLGVQ